MSKPFYKKIFFILISFILVNLMQSKEITLPELPFNETNIGEGLDIYKIKPKKSALISPTINEIQENKNITYKIKFIPDIQSLAKEIKVSNIPSLIFTDYPKTKFIEDIKIDDYSLSYLIHIKVVNSVLSIKEPIKLNEEALKILSKKDSNNKKLSEFEKRFGNFFLKGVEKGGEFIALIKIIPNSKFDYKNIKEELKYIGLKWNKKEKILKYFKKLSKNHAITTKNLIISNAETVPSENIEEIFKNAETFSQKNQNHSAIIGYILSSYDIFKEYKKISQKRKNSQEKYLKKAQNLYMDYITLSNDLSFIIKNDKQFRFDMLKKKEQTINYKKISDKSLNHSLLIKLNFQRYKKGEINEEAIVKDIPPLKKYLNNLLIPPRYKASLKKEPLKTPEKKIFASKENKNAKDFPYKDKKAPWILLKSSFHIEKNGKIIFLTTKIRTKTKNGKYLSNTNHEIVFDSYIDYPGLRFVKISKKEGSLFTDTISEKLNWTKFNGEGVIKSAFCGYDIEGEEKKINMGCVKISFDKLKVVFEHVEDFLKEPVVYHKAADIFSFVSVSKNGNQR